MKISLFRTKLADPQESAIKRFYCTICEPMVYCALPYLSDGHGAEDVQEDEGAVGEVLAHQVAMGDSSEQGEGFKGQLGHNMAIKPGG